jgi:hypothetical protein
MMTKPVLRMVKAGCCFQKSLQWPMKDIHVVQFICNHGKCLMFCIMHHNYTEQMTRLPDMQLSFMIVKLDICSQYVFQ